MKAIIILCVAVTVGISAAAYPYIFQKPEPAPPPVVRQAQKFRFGEQCPDGLRVEYINTFRLPKSVVCQKEIGE